MTKQLTASEEILGTIGQAQKKRKTSSAVKEKETKSEQTTILLRPTTKEQLKELAWRRRTSFNELINQICEEHLEKSRKELE